VAGGIKWESLLPLEEKTGGKEKESEWVRVYRQKEPRNFHYEKQNVVVRP